MVYLKLITALLYAYIQLEERRRNSGEQYWKDRALRAEALLRDLHLRNTP
jgi:hypothetical protein